MFDLKASAGIVRRCETLPRHTPLGQAAELLAAKSESCLCIVDGEIPVGILTERDLTRVMAQCLETQVVPQLTVADVMTSPVISVIENTPLDEALTLARTRGIRHLPVVNSHDHLLGVLTQTNMLDAYVQEIQLHDGQISEEVEMRTEKLNAANKMLQALAMQDSMLGIGNRRAMEVDIKHTQAACKRYGTAYSLALLDIDYFKLYNDHYGHLAGDTALKQTTKIIRNHIRGADRLYRYGGEEFLLLLPDTNAEQALHAVNLVKNEISNSKIPHAEAPKGILTISGGVADGDADNWVASVDAADRALYQAKQAGRDRVCLGALEQAE